MIVPFKQQLNSPRITLVYKRQNEKRLNTLHCSNIFYVQFKICVGYFSQISTDHENQVNIIEIVYFFKSFFFIPEAFIFFDQGYIYPILSVDDFFISFPITPELLQSHIFFLLNSDAQFSSFELLSYIAHRLYHVCTTLLQHVQILETLHNYN